MSIKLVAALVLAIPTFGISLAVLVAYKFYEARHAVNAVDKALVYLADEGTGERTCFDEISYLRARAYLEEKGDFVEQVNLLEIFLLCGSKQTLLVEIDKEPLGVGAVFRVENIDWLVELQKWARAGNLPDRDICLVDLYKLQKFSDAPFDVNTGEPLLERDVEQLPPNFHRLPKLERLFLNSKTLVDLGSNLSLMKSLRLIHAYGCKLIPPEVGQLERLEYLVFSGGTVEHLPAEMTNLKSLIILQCNDNNLRLVPDFLGEMQNLHILDLRRNHICSIPDSITANNAIKKLLLGDNQLSRLPPFPKRPVKHESKDTIDLAFNKFETIPEEIFELDLLSKLIMCGNPMAYLPASLPMLNVKDLLVFGEQKNLKLTEDQVVWLKNKNDGGCQIWLACDDLVLGDVDKWRKSVALRSYSLY